VTCVFLSICQFVKLHYMCQFGQLILRKIIETVAYLPPDLILKLQFIAPNSISVGAPLQTPYLDFRGPTFKGNEGRGENWKGRGGNEKGKGRKGRQAPPSPFPNSLRHFHWSSTSPHTTPTRNGISFGSAILHCIAHGRDQQIHRHTTLCSVCSNRPHYHVMRAMPSSYK